jgi:hypothetical protein
MSKAKSRGCVCRRGKVEKTVSVVAREQLTNSRDVKNRLYDQLLLMCEVVDGYHEVVKKTWRLRVLCFGWKICRERLSLS